VLSRIDLGVEVQSTPLVAGGGDKLKMATYAHVPLSAKEATRTCGPSDGEYAYWPKFTLCEVQKHHRLHDGWVVVHDR